jgi:hypothetical protein
MDKLQAKGAITFINRDHTISNHDTINQAKAILTQGKAIIESIDLPVNIPYKK